MVLDKESTYLNLFIPVGKSNPAPSPTDLDPTNSKVWNTQDSTNATAEVDFPKLEKEKKDDILLLQKMKRQQRVDGEQKAGAWSQFVSTRGHDLWEGKG